MVIDSFELARLPSVSFGEGVLQRVPEIAASFGSRMLLLTGAESFRTSRHWPVFSSALEQHGLTWDTCIVEEEPSPERIDEIVSKFRSSNVELLVGIGGGSVIDAAKAVAGLLIPGNSVADHLEGVGKGVAYEGPAVPWIAVPTTAGTGSEATKNAVLSVRGHEGFKKSFRHAALVARHAVIDPLLLESCPPELVAADGMDALTQLIESFVSKCSNPFTDALVMSALEAVRDGLMPWYENRDDVSAARERMAYASWISGVALAQTGLGAVHGLASPLGAFFPVPHGVVCGTLVASAIQINVAAMRERQPDDRALGRYARVHAVLAGTDRVDTEEGPEALVELVRDWTLRLDLPRLGAYGVRGSDVERVVDHSRGSSMHTNPIELTDEEIAAILRERL
jgi:alcohol dehydrogenase class IV